MSFGSPGSKVALPREGVGMLDLSHSFSETVGGGSDKKETVFCSDTKRYEKAWLSSD